jgi:hypothetical protein
MNWADANADTFHREAATHAVFNTRHATRLQRINIMCRSFAVAVVLMTSLMLGPSVAGQNQLPATPLSPGPPITDQDQRATPPPLFVSVFLYEAAADDQPNAIVVVPSGTSFETVSTIANVLTAQGYNRVGLDVTPDGRTAAQSNARLGISFDAGVVELFTSPAVPLAFLSAMNEGLLISGLARQAASVRVRRADEFGPWSTAQPTFQGADPFAEGRKPPASPTIPFGN